MSRTRTALIALLLGFFASVLPANAQPLGTFRWQLQPYCNILTVNVVQQGGIYTLDGTDDRCAATQAASVVGLAFLNPSGSVGFGLTTVLPGGTPIHIEATINMTSLNGTWRDSAGNTGTMIFTPGPGIGGSPRPVPSGGVAPGSITSVQIASGAVGNTQLAANSISGANVVDASLSSADLSDAPRTAASEVASVVLTGTASTVTEVTITAPAAGRIIANASGYFYMTNGATLDTGRCTITTGTTVDTSHLIYVREFAATSYYGVPFAGTRAFDVAAGSSTTIRLVCDAFSGNVTAGTPSLNAFFIAG